VDWKCDRLYKMIRSHQPEALIIDNTGIGAQGQVGHPMIDSVTFEQARPKPINRKGHTRHLAAEMCQTLNGNWGIGKRDFAHKSPGEVIETLATCRGVGANYLLNIGPTAEGAVTALDAEILKTVGRWAALHEPAVYDARPCGVSCLGKDHFIAAGDKGYYFVHDLAVSGHENVTVSFGGKGPRAISNLKRPIRRVRWLDNGEELRFTQDVSTGIAAIDFTGYPFGTHLVVRIAEIEFADKS
jgi:alpha-L-fucosidase